MELLASIKLPKDLAEAGIRSILTAVLQKDGLEGDCGFVVDAAVLMVDENGHIDEQFAFEVRQLVGKTIKCRSGLIECSLDRKARRLNFIGYYKQGINRSENNGSIRRLTLCPTFLWRALMDMGEFAPILADLPELK